jgi:hypothetical protein
MDIGRQFIHTMGKGILLEAQKHIDDFSDTYSKHYGPPEDEEAHWNQPPENVDTDVTRSVIAQMGMHKAHNEGDYEKAHGLLGTIHGLLHRIGKNLPTNDAERAYPVYQAAQAAKAKIQEAGDKYADLMTTEPPKEQ